MRASRYLIATLKETPADAEVISHQLMLRSGMIRKLASGLYTWLPLGLKVLGKVESIVREEMDRSGALECSMPVVQPAELWEESGRWNEYGGELLRIKDRHERAFCLGPTHEEVITDIARNELKSYKQLPINLYQIQTKFRDERRPRFGVMRAREFLMKDAYSFHLGTETLDEVYQLMHSTYCKIFDRIGLDYRPVQADSGSIGGDSSHEFHVLAQSGEDDIAFSDQSDYAANIEMAEALAVDSECQEVCELTEFDTPNQKTIDDLAVFTGLPSSHGVKTLFVMAESDEDSAETIIALVLRGDHSLNEIKAEKIEGVAEPLKMADEELVFSQVGAHFGSLGPVGLNDIRVIVDRSVENMQSMICGANKDGVHFKGANLKRDVPRYEIADLRNVLDGDQSPDGQGKLSIKRGIEVGHIFKLGEKYSKALNATVLDENGKANVMQMGCYGIGVSRVVAASIEQNHDDRGIIWPLNIAPFQLAILPLNMHKSEQVAEAAERLYAELSAKGLDVLLDDRNERPGIKFADSDLMGIPHRIVISERGLNAGTVEYKSRTSSDNQDIALSSVHELIEEHIIRHLGIL